jgi:hypothetical protein
MPPSLDKSGSRGAGRPWLLFIPPMSPPGRRKRSPEKGKSLWDSLYPTLDLHGRTAAEAERDAERWLAERQLQGDSTVRLVTGRGLHSLGPPILPGAIEGLLNRLRGSIVQAHEREPGGGAYRVRLERRPGVAATPPATPPVDPVLAREAAEALADLGITPTPALIAAEARRITEKRHRDGA